MTDPLQELQRHLRDQAPPPRPEARQAAIAAALSAFDREISTPSQGSEGEERQRGEATSRLRNLFRRRPMTLAQPRLRFALAGGASLAVLVLAATVTFQHANQGLGIVNDFGSRAPEPKREDRQQAATKPNVAAPAVVLEEDPERAEPPLQELAAAPPAAQAPRQSGSRVRALLDPAQQPRAMAGESRQQSADLPAPQAYRDQGRDRFTEIEANPVKPVREAPVSTFSVDVDTASYSFMRAALNNGVLPQKDAVRVEELINYFPYDYAPPADREQPFAASVSVLPTPWNEGTKLVHIGIKGYSLEAGEAPRANLVFLIDTSGSMNAPAKLPLLINGFKLLLERLDDEDSVAIVTYAGSAGTVLAPTPVKEKAKILAALERLRAGGSTAGAEGLRQAYALAEQSRRADGVNRVILATDGDFNVGITDQEELKAFIERKRDSGISLSVLGFGRGNLNDALMQTLAQNGNGNAAYIDSLNEARKVLVEQAGGTLFTIAKDVKLQIEFNPATVAEYRLIGYETRLLAREDFNNDRVDAGDIGAGHQVTALYEITPTGSPARLVEDLRYAAPAEQSDDSGADEYAFLKIRYKLPDGDQSRLITTPVTPAQEVNEISAAATDTRFSAAVAAFGQILRGGRYTGTFDYDRVIALAQAAKGDDPFGYRAEFINLVRLAKSAAALEPQNR